MSWSSTRSGTDGGSSGQRRKATPGQGKTAATLTKKASSKSSPSLVGDLDLRSDGKKALQDFVTEKKPKSQAEQCTVAVYYLRHILEVQTVNVDHVYTVFKAMKWRLPANLTNRMQQVKTTKGWLDTSNMSAIDTTTVGENYVEHDLPIDSAG